MYRVLIAVALLSTACSRGTAPNRVRITEFKADPSSLASGVTGRLCYGVENADRTVIAPRVETILPSSHNCIEITPRQTTVYTLTAYGADGTAESKEAEVKVGAPQPRVASLTARPLAVKRGKPVKICFKLENAKSVTAKPGKLDRRTNCLTDYPKKTTTYQVIAHGDSHEQDTGTVTVSVLR